jgi:molecular chaperone GrpE
MAQQEQEKIPMKQLERELEETRSQLLDQKTKYLYASANFENFKKSVVRERAELIKFGWEPMANELLENIDNLERAIAHLPSSADRTLVEGLRLVLRQFRATLEKYGVKIIETEKAAFNPDVHEAVALAPSEKPSGSIVEQHAPGYTLHGRLLRPARVTVSSGNENRKERNRG